MYLLNGKYIDTDRQLTLGPAVYDPVKHGAGQYVQVINRATTDTFGRDALAQADVRTRLGLVFAADPAIPDQRLYKSWTRGVDGQYVTVARTAPELAAYDAKVAAAAKDAQDAADAKAHVKLNALKAMSPLQVQTWVTNNVTTLAQAQDAIATLAIAVAILARGL